MSHQCSAKVGDVMFNRADKHLTIRCGDDSIIKCEELQVDTKARMSAVDFRNGYMVNIPTISFDHLPLL
jgi:methionyl-tRNA formyltransferase